MYATFARTSLALLAATLMLLAVSAVVAAPAAQLVEPAPSNQAAGTAVVSPLPPAAKITTTARAAPVTSLTGWFTIIWGDGQPGSKQTSEIYNLTDDQGKRTQLLIDEQTLRSVGGPLAINGQRVTVVGTPTSVAASGSTSSAFRAQSIQLAQPSRAPLSIQASTAVTGSQPWVSIACKFSDVIVEPKSLSYFQDMYRGTWPGLDHYWREQSYDLVNVLGSGAVGWYTLPQPRSYYVYDMNSDGQPDADLDRLFNDCTAAADASIYFPNYVGINLMFNDTLDCCSWGGGYQAVLDGVMRTWRITWEPPWGYQTIAVLEHEMGHGFGLPHSSGAYGQVYDNQWDVMSDIWSNCNRLTDPIFGCLGQHTISYFKDRLGWIAPGQRYVVQPGNRVTVTLEQLALPQTGNYLYVQVPIQGLSTWFYSIEARRNISQANPAGGYDYKLPGSAVILHKVDATRLMAQVIDIDGNGNTGDAGAMWVPGETFDDSVNGITVTVVSATATGYVVSIESRPIALSGVSINGPTKGNLNATYSFTATAVPITASLPITYVWQAADQTGITHTNNSTDTISFAWNTLGVKTITVTASNRLNAVTNSMTITIGALYVAMTGSDIGNSCGNSALPCATVQHAVDVAVPGDDIRVAAGIYTGVSARAGITQMVYLSKTVAIRGGYTTTNWLTSYPNTQTTTLDARAKGRVFYIANTVQPTIEGLRITGGNAAGLGGQWGDGGGGIYVALFARPTVRQCVITNNTAQMGGGVFLAQSYATFDGNTVMSNSAMWNGGGLLALFSSGDQLESNLIMSNTAMYGGGVYLYSAGYPQLKAFLTNNIIADNRGSANGSGLYINGGDHRLLHTTVAHNTGGDGSGIYATGASIALTNTIVASHTIGLYATADATVTLKATLWGSGIWINTAERSGLGTVVSGTINVRGDPAFAAPQTSDYHLNYTSAAIDAGIDAGVYNDIDGDPRPVARGYDIGADEFSVPPQFTMTKQASASSVYSGTVLTYTIRITNTGAYDLHARVTDTLPLHVTPSGLLTWTPVISAFRSAWIQTIVITVENGYVGVLTNTVQASTDEGARGAFTTTVTVVEPPPVANFMANPTSGLKPLAVVFTDTSIGTVNSWIWTFGDGGTSTSQNPSHQYGSAGVFTASLRVTGPGGSSVLTRTNYITVTEPPPVANFMASPTSGLKPLTVAFTDASSGVISAWSWAFGDGGTSSAQNPSHQYASAGVFTASLRVTGPGGSSTLTRTNYITVLEPPPVASFTANPTSGLKPLTVVFTDTSNGVTSSWAWTFGDGGTSATQNPSHQYNTAGVYTVSLRVTGPGGSSILTRTNYITVTEPPPVANFTANLTNGLKPLTVVFTDTSTGAISSWSWAFGDGGTSAVQNPSHQYNTAGVYTVSLSVTGPGGSNSLTRSNYITVTEPPPVANFTANPTSGLKPLMVVFTDTSSGVISSWSWTFGDGGTSSVQNPNHQYTLAGVFTASLRVTGPGGSSILTRTNYITVTEPPPVANFTASPTSGLKPLTVIFADTSTGTISSWVWAFGDGGTSGAQNPSHQYTSAGVFTVSLQVTGPGGSSILTRTNYIAVTEPPPAANFTATPTNGLKPLTVAFTDTSTGLISSWAWMFGDGSTSSVPNPSHQYLSAGIFSVTLQVSGPGGASFLTRTNYITVTEPPPTANFVANPTSGLKPLTVAFTDTSTGAISAWTWTFGDGSTSATQNPSHQYNTAGVYTVSLRVTGPGGSSILTHTNFITVTEPPPVANFTADPVSGPKPLTVVFADTSSGVISSWAWTFGDGGTNSTRNPSHQYNTAGVYTVSLRVTGPGGSNSLTRTNYITVTEPPPVANFTAHPTSGLKPLTVVFTDTSTGAISSWAWTFGDGGTSATQNPSHQYTSAGFFTVTLQVSGPGGSSLLTRTNYITVTELPPVANFTANPTSGVKPLTVVFTDTSTGAIGAWAWAFGDGGMSTAQNPAHQYTATGVFTISLRVTGPGGSNTLTRTNYITVTEPPPSANFTANPISGFRPLTVAFTDTSTGTATAWSWGFGDGGLSTQQNPTHTYTALGVYTVSLQVSGPGGTGTLTRTNYITVTEPPPTAGFTANPTSGLRPLAVNFTDTSTGIVTSWAWAFGDSGTSAQQNPTHTYTVIGVYTVSLRVSGPGGANTLTRTNYITVTEPPPAANFTANPMSGLKPLTVAFTDTSAGVISAWAWAFGDGDTSSVQNPLHQYSSAGIFTASLRVTGPGGSSTLTRTNYITVTEPPPVANFTASPTNGLKPFTVVFTDTSSGVISSWLWMFGDAGTSGAQNPSHQYTSAGVFTVSLRVIGPGGSSSLTRTSYITVTEPPPVANFTATPLFGQAPLTVYFADQSTGLAANWLWQFGDGLTSTLPSPSHTYRLAGLFGVTLTVSGPGGTNTLFKDKLITVTNQFKVYLPITLCSR